MICICYDDDDRPSALQRVIMDVEEFKYASGDDDRYWVMGWQCLADACHILREVILVFYTDKKFTREQLAPVIPGPGKETSSLEVINSSRKTAKEYNGITSRLWWGRQPEISVMRCE
jgi:hypothetical protein